MDTNFHDILTIFSLKLANMILAESSFFDKNTLAKKSQTHYKNYGWPPTKFSKMVAHRPISKILVGHRPKFQKWLLTDPFQKFWLATDQLQFDKCAHL